MDEKQSLNTSSTKNKTKSFMKKNAYYFALVGLVLCLALVIGLTSLVSNSHNQGNVEVNTGNIEFIMPVANATILKGYNANELQYNKVLNEWSIHKALDLKAENGANVMACYDGKVVSITTDILDGTCITIDHGNNLKTVYKSLSEDVLVKINQEVKTGEIIGKASASSTGETTDSAQVHFEVWKDDALVDPAGYIKMEEK